MTLGQMAGRWMYLVRVLERLYAAEKTELVQKRIDTLEQEKTELAEKLRQA
jgi:hypothetical protein